MCSQDLRATELNKLTENLTVEKRNVDFPLVLTRELGPCE